MTHEEALNKILHNCCGSLSDEEIERNGGYQEYVVDVCCGPGFIVTAKNHDEAYEIKGIRRE